MSLAQTYHQTVEPRTGRFRRSKPLPAGLHFYREHRNWLLAFERLNTTASPSDRPWCCYLNTIIFYRNRAGLPPREIDRVEGQLFQGAWTPVLLWRRGSWWEIGTSWVVCIGGDWYRITRCYRNGRDAIDANREAWLYDGCRHPLARRLIAATRPLRDLLRTLRLWPGKPRRGQEIAWYLRD